MCVLELSLATHRFRMVGGYVRGGGEGIVQAAYLVQMVPKNSSLPWNEDIHAHASNAQQLYLDQIQHFQPV